MTESELVAILHQGLDHAWTLAEKRYGQDLYACAAHLLGSGPDAENAIQEAWLTAHLKVQAFEWRGEGSLFGWLRQIAVYKAFEILRSKHRLLATEADRLEALSVKAAQQAHEQGQVDLAKQALVAVIRQVVVAMGEPCSRLLDLREIQGQSYNELSTQLSWPLGTVMSRLARCRRLLRQAVESLLGEAP